MNSKFILNYHNKNQNVSMYEYLKNLSLDKPQKLQSDKDL